MQLEVLITIILTYNKKVNMFLNLDEIINLKNFILDNFNEKLHVHDTCGGQYFTLDTQIDNLENVTNDYFSKKNLQAKFSNDKLSFTIERL